MVVAVEVGDGRGEEGGLPAQQEQEGGQTHDHVIVEIRQLCLWWPSSSAVASKHAQENRPESCWAGRRTILKTGGFFGGRGGDWRGGLRTRWVVWRYCVGCLLAVEGLEATFAFSAQPAAVTRHRGSRRSPYSVFCTFRREKNLPPPSRPTADAARERPVNTGDGRRGCDRGLRVRGCRSTAARHRTGLSRTRVSRNNCTPPVSLREWENKKP